MEKKSLKFRTSVSACEPDPKTRHGCIHMCGMCPVCAFAPTPPASTRCVWQVSDEFKRRFVVELLLRCRNHKVLEGIHGVLCVTTSWTSSTYARSRRPTSPRDYPRFGAGRPPDGKPLGMDLNEVWDWFNSSPDWIQSRYLCRLFSFCDSELLRMVANLTSVLLVRQKRGFLQFNGNKNVSRGNTSQHDETSDGDSEDPALMVVPGSSKSVSGVSRHRDFIGCLPVDLSKRILGLLDERTLRRCLEVCPCWKLLAQETVEEIKFRRLFQEQNKEMMKRYKSINKVNHTYANIVEVPVPVKDDEKVDVHPEVQKVKPFEAAYAKIKTKPVTMEERNVYCGAYFSTVLLDKEDTHRVVDYRGGPLMAASSKDSAVRLLRVASETKVVSAMKGHVGRIRAALLCEERGLLITTSWDASIRCWSLKTDRCEMRLYGHTGSVNCLDVHADRLVSGAKDCKVKGKDFEDFHFKHRSPVQCVRINTSTVYSSCVRGLVRVWDMENASLLRVIDAHRSSVKCLFVDERYFLSGDFSGQVMAWSVSCDAKECLMTFNHPKEVKSLTLVYLRVITGCVDGKIRIFNFLTGDCLRDIAVEAETGRILSLHCHDNRILVNATSSVKLYQFAKVFWDYTEPPEGGQGDAEAQVGAVPGRSFVSVGADRSQKMHHTRSQARERCESAKPSLMRSEKATSERMKRRGLHRPLTCDSILLRVNGAQKARCADEAGVNAERNAGLRDSWGPRPSQDPEWITRDVHPTRAETRVPILKRDAGQNMIKGRDATTRRHCWAIERVSGFTARAAEGPRAPECTLMRPPPPDPERCVKTAISSSPRISPGIQLEECWVRKDLTQDWERKPSTRNKTQEKKT